LEEQSHILTLLLENLSFTIKNPKESGEMGKILHLLLLLLKVSVLEFIISVSAFTSPASQPSLSPVYTSMASFSPGISLFLYPCLCFFLWIDLCFSKPMKI